MALASLGNLRGKLASSVESGRRMYENLNEREKKLVVVLGGVLLLIVVVLPLYLLTSSISDMEERNREIATTLREIDRARPSLRERELERKAAEERYRTPAPPLGSFIEAKAGEQGLTVREVNDQPEKDLGDYKRRHTRVTLPNVGIKEVVNMMAAIENGPYPVAIERIQVEHFGERYNLQLGVVAYDKKGVSNKKGGSKSKSKRPPGGRAGPPQP